MYPAMRFLMVTEDTSVRLLTMALFSSKSMLNAWGYLLTSSIDTLLMYVGLILPISFTEWGGLSGYII